VQKADIQEPPLRADSVEKVRSRSLKEIRLNSDAIFDLICLPPQIDYGRLGLTRSRAMRSPASFSKESTCDAEKILQCRRTDFFNRIGHKETVKDASLATFPDVIEVEKLKGFFVKHKVQGVHLTIFCVDKLWSNGYSPNGSFARSLDIAVISSQRGPNTSAHEAGHFLGYNSKSGSKPWDSQGHTLETDPKTGNEDRAEDIKMLMRGGGAGWKIPFNLVKGRDFPG
jgi:hypothetical protein